MLLRASFCKIEQKDLWLIPEAFCVPAQLSKLSVVLLWARGVLCENSCDMLTIISCDVGLMHIYYAGYRVRLIPAAPPAAR